jgi:N6-adenosine-specific RNA methylase IME4/ParB-like chromosome segregation protein Spo0J
MIPFHPLADIFPLMQGEEFDALVADIKANGQQEAIVLHDEMILDGRNRYRACMAADIEPVFRPFPGEDPLAFVISLNLKRRHLNESQRAMVASKLATLRQGARTDLSPIGEMSQGRAAELLNVGKRSVERAAEVRDHGAPELVRAVEHGAVSVSTAADIAQLPHEDQRAILTRDEREIIKAAKQIRARVAKARYAERMKKWHNLKQGDAPLPTGTRYPVICADPPWKFFAFDENSGFSGQAADHYPSMTIDEICALPVSSLAADDAVLFLWVVNAELFGAKEVIEAWGFEFVTNLVWTKDRWSLGHWVRNQHELLLIARRGNIPIPLPENRPSSVIDEPRREHSRKPDEAYSRIEQMYPDVPRIELFARHSRPGWDSWGNEAPAAALDDDLAIPGFLRREPGKPNVSA